MFWAENCRIVDTKINAWSSLFLNIVTNLILRLNTETWEELANLKNRVLILYPWKNGLRRKSKVCQLDTQIK